MVGISINLGSTFTSYACTDAALEIRPRLAVYTTLQFKWLVRWRGIGLKEVFVCMRVLRSGVRLESRRWLAAIAAQSWDTVPFRWRTNAGPLSWLYSFTLNNWPSAVPYTHEIRMSGWRLSLQFESTKFKRLFKGAYMLRHVQTRHRRFRHRLSIRMFQAIAVSQSDEGDKIKVVWKG